MSIIRFFRKLSGLVRSGDKIEAPESNLSLNLETKKLNSNLPTGDRVAKKRNWISAKNKK